MPNRPESFGLHALRRLFGEGGNSSPSSETSFQPSEDSEDRRVEYDMLAEQARRDDLDERREVPPAATTSRPDITRSAPRKTPDGEWLN